MLASLPLVTPTLLAGGDRTRELIRLGAVCLGFLSLWMSYRLALRFAQPGAALAATIAIWLATPVPVYLYLLPLTIEVGAMFSAAMVLTVALSARDGRGSRSRWLVWAAGAGIAIAAVWMANTGFRMNWAHPPLVAAASSAARRAWFSSPVVLAAAAGLILAIRRRPAAGSILAAAGVLFFYLAAAYSGPAESSFGGRLLMPLTPILLCGLAAFVDTLVGNRGRIAWIGALTAVLALALWNAGLMFQWKTGRVSDRGPMNVRDVAAHQTDAVERAARGLVNRYANDWKRIRE